MIQTGEVQVGTASWSKELVPERIQRIPEAIDLLGGFDNVKFRLALDYDPTMPAAPFTLAYVPVVLDQIEP